MIICFIENEDKLCGLWKIRMIICFLENRINMCSMEIEDDNMLFRK